MTKAILTLAACAMLLWAGTALAMPSPQQKCDYARVTASKNYVSCVQGAVAKWYRAVGNPEVAFFKCRHAYFNKWSMFQSNASLTGSTCQPLGGARFVDNGDGTVTDNLSALVWEKKTNLDGTTNFGDPHDADNTYSWSAGSNNEDGTAFTSFLTTGLNTPGFAGANGWHLPTLAELQTIVLDFVCTGGGCYSCPSPCVDPALGPTATAGFGLVVGGYWSATAYLGDSSRAWLVHFNNGLVGAFSKTTDYYVRAVRGGL